MDSKYVSTFFISFNSSYSSYSEILKALQVSFLVALLAHVNADCN